MRGFFLVVLVVSTLSGCATMNLLPDGELRASYAGPSASAAGHLARAVDGRPYSLAGQAMENGLSPSLRMSDHGVVFNVHASGFYYDPMGYALPDIVSVDGWYARTGAGHVLPRLGETVVADMPFDDIDVQSGIVVCPKDRIRRTVAEQAACAEADITRHLLISR